MVMNKIKFNLSPSYINLYEESQLRFFYSKIKPIMEDTPTVQGYGVLGSDVHNCLEAYAKDNTINILELFDKYIEHHSDIQLEGFGHKKILRLKCKVKFICL